MTEDVHDYLGKCRANIMWVQCVILERNRVCATFLISIKAMSAAVIPDYTIY